jgi:hypothetical protein
MGALTNPERIKVMGEVIKQITKAGYTYRQGAGQRPAQMPPPVGSGLNCSAAADVAIALGEQRGVKPGLKKVKAGDEKNGFFVPATPGLKALGAGEPMVNTPLVKGWEFDYHYRVKDTVTNMVYDPTFGSSSVFDPVGNPPGVKGTSTVAEGLKQTSVYGLKYQIIRTSKFETHLLSQAPVAGQYVVSDKDYT